MANGRVGMPEATNAGCCKCGAPFHCGAASGEATCWCEQQPRLAPAVGSRCLCPECLKKAIEGQHSQSASPLTEGEDYYVEGKSIVFTAGYHLRRGYCCKRGCRHCPYR